MKTRIIMIAAVAVLALLIAMRYLARKAYTTGYTDGQSGTARNGPLVKGPWKGSYTRGNYDGRYRRSPSPPVWIMPVPWTPPAPPTPPTPPTT